MTGFGGGWILDVGWGCSGSAGGSGSLSLSVWSPLVLSASEASLAAHLVFLLINQIRLSRKSR